MSIIKNDSFFTHGRSLGVYSFAIVALFAFALVSYFQRSIETPTSVAVSHLIRR